MKNPNPRRPVYPVSGDLGDAIEDDREGLSKRELFAAMAMQGILVNNTGDSGIAEVAVEQADALLKQLEKGGGK
jgi:hypothetical protein